MATGFALYQQALSEFAAIGAKRLSTEFRMDVLDETGGVLTEWNNQKLSYLVRTAQIPSMKKTIIEHNIAFGATSRDAGPPDIEHEMQVAFVDAVDSRMLKFLQDWFNSGNLYDVQLTLIGPNDKEGADQAGKVFTLKECFINRDAADLDVASNTEALQLQTTLVYKYCLEFFQANA